MSRTVFIGFLLLITVGFLGCKPAGLSGLVKLEGVVYLDDERIDEARITFSPEPGQPEPIRAASAISRSNGSFTATTLNFNDGIYPGKYRISVEKVEVTDLRTPEQKARDEAPVYDPDPRIPPTPENWFQQKSIVPMKYNDFASSGLTVEVGKSGQRNFEIRLTSQ